MPVENGRVVAVGGDHLWVATTTRPGCAKCAGGAGCGQSLLGGWGNAEQHLKLALDGRSPSAFTVGDRVQLTVADDALLKSALLLYGLPLLALLVGAIAGQQWAGDPASMAGAVLGLALGALGVSQVAARENRWQPKLLDAVAHNSQELSDLSEQRGNLHES